MGYLFLLLLQFPKNGVQQKTHGHICCPVDSELCRDLQREESFVEGTVSMQT